MSRKKTCGCPDHAWLGRRAPRRSVFGALEFLPLATTVSDIGHAQTTLSPDAALARLKDGNQRYMTKQMRSFDEDLAIIRENTVAKQEPFAAVLSCVDSRVPVEIIFDEAIGRIFVTRVAGNVCTPEVIASLESGGARDVHDPGARARGLWRRAGHDCRQGSARPDSALWYAPLRQAVESGGSDLEASAQANAKIQANLLQTASPVLAGLISQGRLKVAAGYYGLANGAVTMSPIAAEESAARRGWGNPDPTAGRGQKGSGLR